VASPVTPTQSSHTYPVQSHLPSPVTPTQSSHTYPVHRGSGMVRCSMMHQCCAAPK